MAPPRAPRAVTEDLGSLDFGGLDLDASPVTAVTEAVSATSKAFRERAKNEKARFKLVTDSEYWVCFCFETRQQKDCFLEAQGLAALGNKHVDGVHAAAILGIDIGPRASFPKSKKLG
jgi:hypothetical protein